MDVRSHDMVVIEAEPHMLRVMQTRCNPRWYADLRCCLPRLCELLSDPGLASDEQFEHAVKQVVAEHCHVDEGGDAVGYGQQGLDRQIRMITDELLKLRHGRAIHSDGVNMAPPMMFG